MNELTWVLFAFVGLTLLLHLTAWVLRLPVASWLMGDLPWLPAHSHGPSDDGQNVDLLTADGVRLEATYLPALTGRRRGVVAFCHELNADRWNALPMAAELRRRGFDVCTFDFRNHGASQRTAGCEPAPWASPREVDDVRTVLDYLMSRSDADRRGVGLVGWGRGASAALCAAAEDRRVRALVIDGPLALERIQAARVRRFFRRSFGPLERLVPRIFVEWAGALARYLGQWYSRSRIASVDQAARQLKAPVLLIGGGQDPYVSQEAIEQLRSEIRGPTKLWIVPEAGHVRASVTEPEAYHRLLVRFFIRHLSRPLSLDPSHPRLHRVRSRLRVASRVVRSHRALGPRNGDVRDYRRRPK